MTVGKRLFCADRFGRGGCGATLRLYLTTRIPGLHVGATAMQAFLTHLEAGSAVELAYVDAVDDCKADAVVPLEPQTSALLSHRSPRNAWRWLKKLDRNLPRFRALLSRPDASACLPFTTRSARLRLLLPGFAQLKAKLGPTFVATFQSTQQAAFLT